MFRRQIRFVWSDSWYIRVNVGDTFQMINFDLINSLLNFWLWLKKSASDLLLLKGGKILIKVCDSWWICGSRGDTFEMIILDFISNNLKCWFKFEFFWFKAVVHTNLIKILVKGCSDLVIRDFDGILTGILLITSVSSERHSIFELRVTSSSSIYPDYWCCYSIKIPY